MPKAAGSSTPKAKRQRAVVTYVAPEHLTSRDLDEIWAFFSRFVERPREAFETKLLGAGEVTLARGSDDGRLCAFTALRVHEVVWDGRPMGAIHTLWSAIDPAFRGQNLTQRAGFRQFLLHRLKHPNRPLYWVFGASTYKSYLLLPRYFKTYWPRPGAPFPPREAALVEQLMQQLEERNWDGASGVIRRHGVSRYREGVVKDSPEALADPNVRFYAEKNPRQDEGDSLMCVCPLTLANWLSLGRALVMRENRPREKPPSASWR